MVPLVDLVNSFSELSVEEQQGDALPLDHASFPYSSDNFRVPYIVTNFRKNTEECVGLEAASETTEAHLHHSGSLSEVDWLLRLQNRQRPAFINSGSLSNADWLLRLQRKEKPVFSNRLRVTQQQRLAFETPEDREARLQQLRVTQQQKLAFDTPEDREARQ